MEFSGVLGGFPPPVGRSRLLGSSMYFILFMSMTLSQLHLKLRILAELPESVKPCLTITEPFAPGYIQVLTVFFHHHSWYLSYLKLLK